VFLARRISSQDELHTLKFTGGGGFFGSILTTRDSTFGGGLKLLRPTFMSWSTFARSCVLTDRRQYRLSPGLQHTQSSRNGIDEPGKSSLGREPQCELLLKHNNRAAEHRAVGQQFEGEGRRNLRSHKPLSVSVRPAKTHAEKRYLVRDVGHAAVEKRQIHLHKVAVYDLQMTCLVPDEWAR
jgi:hypothetical protein